MTQCIENGLAPCRRACLAELAVGVIHFVRQPPKLSLVGILESWRASKGLGRANIHAIAALTRHVVELSLLACQIDVVTPAVTVANVNASNNGSSGLFGRISSHLVRHNALPPCLQQGLAAGGYQRVR